MAIDMLWHGLSSKPPLAGPTLPAYGDQVLDLLDTLGLERAHVEGEAVGGHVALWLGINRPDRLLKLVLNNSGGVRFKEGAVRPRVQTSGQYRSAAQTAVETPTRETVRQRLERLMVSPDRVTDELVEVRYRYYSDPETNHYQLLLRPTSAEGFDEEEITTIRVPTLVLTTDQNPLRGADAAERMASLIPGAQYFLLKDAAIWSQWEQPAEHDRVVTAFLKGEQL
jgi:pimeloyl-ACP methyl ester carboxylesterase